MVNAETGVVYYAEHSLSLVPKMNAEQREKLAELIGNGEIEEIDYLNMDLECKDFARE